MKKKLILSIIPLCLLMGVFASNNYQTANTKVCWICAPRVTGTGSLGGNNADVTWHTGVVQG